MPRISSFYGITIWMYYDEAHHTGQKQPLMPIEPLR